jgi:stalled ribosome rescue protein Dom34
MDEGIAHVCNIRNNMTVLKHKIDKNIPKKKSGFIYNLIKGKINFLKKLNINLLVMNSMIKPWRNFMSKHSVLC